VACFSNAGCAKARQQLSPGSDCQMYQEDASTEYVKRAAFYLASLQSALPICVLFTLAAVAQHPAAARGCTMDCTADAAALA
jgi:hypothetical protein